MEKNKILYLDKLTDDDLNPTPKRFDNDQDGHPIAYTVDFQSTFWMDGFDKPPVTIFRHNGTDHVRWAGIAKAGDTPLSVHTPAHVNDIGNWGSKYREYRKICDNPVTYGMDFEEPYCTYRISREKLIYQDGKDGSVLNVIGTPFPYAIFMHRSPESCNASCMIMQQYIISGTYEGKPVSGVCSFNLQHISQIQGSTEEKEAEYAKTTSYIAFTGAGVRNDGRRELISLYGLPGKALGVYWIEGEEPIVDTAKIVGDWYHLPYVDDGTCVAPIMDITVGNKTVHYDGKYGLKGFGLEWDPGKIDWPSYGNRRGTSHVWGTWYEKDDPSKYIVQTIFLENMDAYDYKLKEAGFNVVD